MARLLLVEDDASLTLSLRLALSRAGHEVVHAATVAAARAAFRDAAPELVVLDLGLPDGDGLELVEAWRKERVTAPIIALTARSALEDRILGLELGADDYVTKPFDMPELLARVAAQLRRGGWTPPPDAAPTLSDATVGRLTLHFPTRHALRDGAPASLSEMEFRLLAYLLEREGLVVTREELLADVWELPTTSRTRTIDTFVYRLRRLIEDDPSDPRHLISHRRTGYRLCITPPDVKPEVAGPRA